MRLLTLEMRETGNRLPQLFLLAFGLALCGLLGCMTLTALVAALFWSIAPVTVLVVITVSYALVGIFLWRRLVSLWKKLTCLPATLEQLRQDRIAFENFLK